MTAAGLFGPEWVSLWLTGATLVLLAASLFFLDMGNRAQRAFALLLFLRGLTFFMGPLRAESAAQFSTVWASIAPYAILPVIPLVLFFLSVYPRRRGLGRNGVGLLVPFGLALGLLAWYVMDHDAYATVRPGAPATYSSFGPLITVSALRLPALAVAAFVLAGDYRRSPAGSAGFSLFLMVAGFTLNGLYDGTLATLDLVAAYRDPAMEWQPWAWTLWWLPVLALPLALAACWRLVPVLRRSRRDPEFQEVRRFFFVAAPLAVASAFVIVLPFPGAQDTASFILGIWRLTIPLLLAYALLRYQLFDIDIRLKANVRRAIILGAFTVTFFLVSEAAENLVQGDRGPLFGIVAAGFLALASRPVQKFADRASDTFMPDTKPIAQQTFAERQRFYLEHYELIGQDGEVTAKERAMLDRLRVTLGLAAEQTAQLEREGRLLDAVKDTSATSAEETPDSKLEIAIKGALVAGTLALVFGMLSQGIESIIPLSNMAAGLVSAALVAVLLGPLEGLADRLTHRVNPKARTEAADYAQRRRAFEEALREALADGSFSERDLTYLHNLQQRLRISRSLRWRLERRTRRALGAGS